jgi:hypothetical protein
MNAARRLNTAGACVAVALACFAMMVPAAAGTIASPALRLVFQPMAPIPAAIEAAPLRLVFAPPARAEALLAAPLKLVFLPVATPGAVAASPLRLVFVPGAAPQGAIRAQTLRLIFQTP